MNLSFITYNLSLLTSLWQLYDQRIKTTLYDPYRYTWLRVADHAMYLVTESGQPYFTPTLVGCAMAVYKPYFDEIGTFDEGLKVWGGESIELAFRVWMCGGRVVTVTCSRVGLQRVPL